MGLVRELRAVGFKGRPDEGFSGPKPHQKAGIRWMQRQEAGGNPAAPGVRGGIMADQLV